MSSWLIFLITAFILSLAILATLYAYKSKNRLLSNIVEIIAYILWVIFLIIFPEMLVLIFQNDEYYSLYIITFPIIIAFPGVYLFSFLINSYKDLTTGAKENKQFTQKKAEKKLKENPPNFGYQAKLKSKDSAKNATPDEIKPDEQH